MSKTVKWAAVAVAGAVIMLNSMPDYIDIYHGSEVVSGPSEPFRVKVTHCGVDLMDMEVSCVSTYRPR